MYRIVNGSKIDMTPDEITAMEEAAAQQAVAERHRP